jgi:polar amino acid transport system permease protein
MAFDLSVITDHAPQFLWGAWLTLRISLVALLLGYALGIIMALVALLPGRLPGLLVGAWVGALRSIPFIITLFVIYYGLPFAGIRLPAYVVGTFALGLFASAYYAEIIRGTILAVPAGQFDSARAIGMTYPQAMRHVIGPQILRALVPPSTNTTLSMMKESAVLSSITVPELTYQGLIVQGQTYAPVEVFAVLTLLYWLMATGIAAVARMAERRFGRAQASAVLRSDIAARYLSLDWRRRA